MKIGRGKFHFRQSKGKLCRVNGNLFFILGPRSRVVPFFEKKKRGEVRVENVTLPFLHKMCERSSSP